MHAIRKWSVRHAQGLSRVYRMFLRASLKLRPLVLWMGEGRAGTLVAPVERVAKQLMFDCRMCGQCVLSDTGLACPMNCGKSMRNGPCGGVRADGGCEVHPQMRCVWLEANDGARNIAGASRPIPATVIAPLDHRCAGRSSWVTAVLHEQPAATPALAGTPSMPNAATAHDNPLATRNFVVTVEIAPPDSPDPQDLLRRAAPFRSLVDGINITDGAGANCHMSSLAASAVLAAHGYNPVFQLACRDRNRIAMQGDLLGAAALGVRNVLCLTGDDVSRGDHPQARPVFDLDAVSLLAIARKMRDQGEYSSGRKLVSAPRLYLGASANPFVPPHAARVVNLEKKVMAGAQFIQTQFCFDLPALQAFMQAVRERELHQRCRIIVGVGTLNSAKALQWMARNVPGVSIPPAILQRMNHACDQRAEGIRICVETIRAITDMDGIAGVHVMGHKNDDALIEIIETAFPGRHGGMSPLQAPAPRR